MPYSNVTAVRSFASTLLALLIACAGGAGLPTGQGGNVALRDLGERAAGDRVEAVVVLRDNRYDELASRVDAMADPQSPQFHHFMSPAEFLATYAPTREQQEAVVAGLKSAGFTIDRTYENRGVIDVSAPTAVAERFFSAPIHDYQARGERRYSDVRPPVVPAAIAPYVLGVELGDLRELRPLAAPAAGGHIGKGPGPPLPPVSSANGAWGPYAYASGYDFPVQHGWDGHGETAIILSGAQMMPSDLAVYLAALQIKRTAPLLQIDIGATPPPVPGAAYEATLDIETVAGLSPGTTIISYRMPNFGNRAVLDGFNYAVAKHKGNVVNASFAECEALSGAFDRGIEQAAVNGGAIGMTFAAGSGDWGPACPDVQNYNSNFIRDVNVPAAAPHVTAVGGTQAQTPVSTQAWNICAQYPGENCTTGGGVSHFWAIPSYQHDVVGSPASRTTRNVPDVAFPAWQTYGVFQGKESVFGGTSLATPIFVALMVQAEEACKTPFGAVNTTTYALVKQRPKGMVVDVTSGNNTWATFPGYKAGPGYDNTSGLGSPKGFTYAAALCGKSPARR